MQRRYLSFVITTLLLSILLISCSSKTQAPSQLATALRGEMGQTLPDKASEWDKLASLARKEGRVVVYGGSGVAEARGLLIRAVKDKFGISLEATGAGGAAQITAKLMNERRAGIYAADVYIGGGGSIVNDLIPNGLLDPFPELLIPEVLDPKVWWDGRLAFVDKGKRAFAMVANPSPPLAISTNLVSKEEIKSYSDLLNPKWKGKMILNDPTNPGIAQFWFAVVSSRIMNLDYMKKLAQMDLIVTRDQRLQVEWLSQGKFLIAIAAQQSAVSQFQKEGVPIELHTPKEGTHVTSSSGNIAILNKAPHTYAAKLFINWLLSKEGQTLFSEATAFQSARIDVPTSHLSSDSIRKPEVKYFSSIDEEFLVTLPESAKIAREIFGSLMK